MCECWRCAIKAARIFYSARQKNQATPRLLLSWLSQYPLNPASVILPSLSLTPSVPLTFPSHSSHLLSYFSFLSVMGFGAVEDWGEMLCVCLWWVVRAVHRRSGQAESNCRCCGAKVIRRAGRGKLNKHHPRQECFHSEQLSACPVYLLHNYHPPQGNSMEQHDHPLGDEEGPRGRRDGQIPQREIADWILLCVSSWK